MKNYFTSAAKIAALLLGGLTGVSKLAVAIPMTYQIGEGSAPGFSGSWLHAGSIEMGDSGFFANGDAMRINGRLTIDLDEGDASGQLTGTGSFGLGSGETETWTLTVRGASRNTHQFRGGEIDILSLDYMLTSAGGIETDGIFYFADRDFNGDTRENGPNYINDDVLYLWGNNWLNENGSEDRDIFVRAGEPALGLDLYGVAVSEPGLLVLMSTGLLAIGFTRRLRQNRS